jgi:hypothetical protein
MGLLGTCPGLRPPCNFRLYTQHSLDYIDMQLPTFPDFFMEMQWHEPANISQIMQ